MCLGVCACNVLLRVQEKMEELKKKWEAGAQTDLAPKVVQQDAHNKLQTTLLTGDEAVGAIEMAKADKKANVDKLLADALAQFEELAALKIGGFPKVSSHSALLDCTVELDSFNGVYKPTGEFTARGFPVWKLESDQHQRFLYAVLSQFDCHYKHCFHTELTPLDDTRWASTSAEGYGGVPVTDTRRSSVYFNGTEKWKRLALKVQRCYKGSVDVAAKWAKAIAEVKTMAMLDGVESVELAEAVDVADGDVHRAHKFLRDHEKHRAQLTLLREAALEQASSEDTLAVTGFPATTVSQYQGRSVDPVDMSSFNGKYRHTAGEVTGDGFPVWRMVPSDGVWLTGTRVLYRWDEPEGIRLEPFHIGWAFDTTVRPRPLGQQPEWAGIWAYDAECNRKLQRCLEPPGKGAVPTGADMAWGFNDGKATMFSGVDLTITDRNLRNEMLVEHAHSGETERVVQLLADGADCNHVNQGRTALYSCAKSNHPGCIRALLAASADIEQGVGERKTTPLMIAGYYGNRAAVECLLDAGADWRNVDADGDTTYYQAHADGKAAFAAWITTHGTDDSQRAFQEELLRDAATHGHVKEVERLLAAGTNVSAVDAYGMSSLFVAAWQDEITVMKVLIDAGANLETRLGSDLKPTPLMTAARNGHLAAVELLLNAGADWTAVNAHGQTAQDRAKQLKVMKCAAMLEAWDAGERDSATLAAAAAEAKAKERRRQAAEAKAKGRQRQAEAKTHERQRARDAAVKETAAKEVREYMKRIGLEAWISYFEKHLPANVKSVKLVRATTAEDLRRMATQANMRLDTATVVKVLKALTRK
jgi:ankyrin repeat protein